MRGLRLLLAIPIGAIAGAFLSLKFDDPPVVAAAGVGAAVAAAVVLILLAVKWPGDVRHDAAARAHPDAVVFSAFKSDDTKAALADLATIGVLPVAPPAESTAVVFDGVGMHVYRGSPEIEPVLEVSWSGIAAIGEGTASVGSRARSALLVEIHTDAGRVVVPFPVITASYLFASARGIARLRAEVEEREATAAWQASVTGADQSAAGPSASSSGTSVGAMPGGSPSAHSYVTPPRLELVPGLSSTFYSRVRNVVTVVGLVTAAALFAVIAFTSSDTSRGSFLSVTLVILACTLVSLGLLYLGARASRREAEAGYTLERMGETRLAQVDPRTGFVIRPVGSRQLTKPQEAEALARVRALAAP